MANTKNNKNTSADKPAAKNSTSNSNMGARKIPAFTSSKPDDTKRRDGPGGN